MKNTVILLGASGYVGTAFAAELTKRNCNFVPVSRSDIDYTRKSELLSLLDRLRPGFLINAAGYTGKPNVDACERDKAACLMGNAVLPGVINEACQEAEVTWGQVSSGCIYSGEREDGTGFKEEDAPNFSFRSPPCSFYSGSKALGEEVLAGAKNCYIWRLRIPFDQYDGPRNYLSKLQRYTTLLEAKNSISHREDFVSACIDSWVQKIPFGIYNVTNPGVVTTSEVVALIKKHLNVKKEFNYFIDEKEFMKIAALTPRSNCLLDSTKMENAGIKMRPVQEAIEQALRQWVPAM